MSRPAGRKTKQNLSPNITCLGETKLNDLNNPETGDHSRSANADYFRTKGNEKIGLKPTTSE
jgi:hypothetical protein